MAKYLIIPIIQTEGMDGYSAIALDCTKENDDEISRLQNMINAIRQLDNKVNEIKYYFPTLSFDLLNDDYELKDNNESYVEEIDEDELETYFEERDCRVDSPMIDVMSDSIRITYNAKWSDSKVEGTFSFLVVDKF